MTQTIAVSNHKGGVAKTTSCLSLGACLAESGKRALVVDFDPQSNLTLAAGFDPESLDCTVADMLGGEADPGRAEAAVQATAMPGLDLLPADQRLLDWEMNASQTPEYPTRLRGLLAAVLAAPRGRYDYILIDCPPSLGALTITALTAANLALIPLQCDYFATRGVANLIAVIEAIRKRTNAALDYALFVTMYDARPLISRRILDKLRENFAGYLCDTVIGLDTRLRESAMANEPVITFAAKTRASSQYRNLANEIMQRVAA